MDKKGIRLPFIMIAELLIVLLIGFAAMDATAAFIKKDTVFKTTVVEDIRMMVDTLAGIPGDAKVVYPNNVSDYILVMDDSSIVLFKEGDSEHQRLKRYFFLPEGYSAEGFVEKKNQVCLEKTAKKIALRECDGIR